MSECSRQIDKLPYFKDQPKYNLEGTDEKFVDTFFPPTIGSVLAKDSNGEFIDQEDGNFFSQFIKAEAIEWKRASEIFPKYAIFEDTIDARDVKQGKIGNCYFLSAIASLCEFPNLIYQIFLSKEINDKGYYELVLFIDGKYQIVIVDDYFPVEKGSNSVYFAQPNQNEIWVMLLEKAWAKVNGGYANIISGWPCEALTVLTGFNTTKILFEEYSTEDIWFDISIADKSDCILCVSSKNEDFSKEVNLIKNHSYTLIDTIEIESKEKVNKLCKLFNPWGYKEWKGDWSDESPLWGESEKKQLEDYEKSKHQKVDKVDNDDGTFWICIEDLIKYFVRADICESMYKAFTKEFEIKGGCTKSPNVFNLFLRTPGRVSLSLMREQWRFHRSLKSMDFPSSIVIAKYDEKSKKFVNLKGAFECNDYCQLSRTLNIGFYVIWIYSKASSDYNFRIMSPCRFKYNYIGNDTNYKVIKEMLIGSIQQVKKQDISKEEVYTDTCDNYQRTGLGYFVVLNNSSSTLKLKIDLADEKDDFCILPKNGKNFKINVNPKNSYILFGLKNDKEKSEFKIIKEINKENTDGSYLSKFKMQLKKKFKIISFKIEDFLDYEIKYDETPIEEYYDSITLGVNEAKADLDFEKIDSSQVMLDELKQKYPDIIQKVIELPVIDDESKFYWGYIDRENGIYIGQMFNGLKNGRGAFKFNSEGSCWVGYWKKNGKNHKGYIYNKEGEIICDCEYKNNKKEGKGMIKYSSGEKYEGMFKNDKRSGQGVYYWDDGSRWEGNFDENEMNGIGKFYDVDGESWEVEYSYGEAVE